MQRHLIRAIIIPTAVLFRIHFVCNRFIWESTFIAEEDLRLDYNLKRYRHKLADLHPNTQYAYYVKAHVTVKSEETSVNVTQGQSEIQYFRTFPNIPLPPFVTTVNKTKNTINVEWFHPSWDDNSGVDRYLIDIYMYYRRFCCNFAQYIFFLIDLVVPVSAILRNSLINATIVCIQNK